MSLARITFELTSRCNLSCRHCLRNRSLENDLAPELVEKVLKQLKPYGISKVGFTGGEPLIHPQFKEVMQRSVELGFSIAFVTNGIKLPAFADFLASQGMKEKIQQICISLDGADAETHDKIRGRGNWKKAMAGLVACKSRELPFAIKYTINTVNLHQIEEMALMAAKLGAVELQISHLHPTPGNMKAGLSMEPSQWPELQEEVSRLKEIIKMRINFTSENLTDEAVPICTQLAMLDYYVDSRGWLCVCCMLPGIAGADAGQVEMDRVADLNTASFAEAHKKLVDLIGQMRLISIERIENGLLSELEHYQCLQCAFQMGKLDWLEEFPKSAWAKMLKKTKGERH
jgi:MoaA/NifB/PqqE/SkfB family radical SAM enzyme